MEAVETPGGAVTNLLHINWTFGRFLTISDSISRFVEYPLGYNYGRSTTVVGLLVMVPTEAEPKETAEDEW